MEQADALRTLETQHLRQRARNDVFEVDRTIDQGDRPSDHPVVWAKGCTRRASTFRLVDGLAG
jgi:hypothetical protein